MVIEAVVDSSVIVAFATLEDHSKWASEKLNEYGYFHTLDLSYYEIANAIRYKLSSRFDQKDAESSFSEAARLMNDFEVHVFNEVIFDAVKLALHLKTAVYDAAFIALAKKLDLRLLTLDIKMVKKLENTAYRGILESPTF